MPIRLRWFSGILTVLLMIGTAGCTKNNEYDPEDYVTSTLSGEYSKDGAWKLYVTVNGEPVDEYGFVRFDSKYLKVGEFKFIEVIPNQNIRVFKDIPLTLTNEGYTFVIDDIDQTCQITISGSVVFGKMTVNIEI